jgi:hypothetical protein
MSGYRKSATDARRLQGRGSIGNRTTFVATFFDLVDKGHLTVTELTPEFISIQWLCRFRRRTSPRRAARRVVFTWDRTDELIPECVFVYWLNRFGADKEILFSQRAEMHPSSCWLSGGASSASFTFLLNTFVPHTGCWYWTHYTYGIDMPDLHKTYSERKFTLE